MKRRHFALILTFAALLGWVATDAAAASRKGFDGTWTLNPAKSDFAGGPAATAGKLVVSTVKKAHKVVVDVAYADGMKAHYEYTALLDGTEAPVSGSARFDSVSVLAPDATTVIRTDRRAGKLVGITTATLDSSGKVMTAQARPTGSSHPLPMVTTVWERAKH